MVSSLLDKKIHRIVKDVIHRGFSENFIMHISYDKSPIHLKIYYPVYVPYTPRLIKTSFSRMNMLNHLLPHFTLVYVPRESVRDDELFNWIYDAFGQDYMIMCKIHEFHRNPVLDHS